MNNSNIIIDHLYIPRYQLNLSKIVSEIGDTILYSVS
jgi:hypothetical protein